MATNPHDIVPAHLAVQAMRDNGYKNAAYAIAELMDNSIQAGATQVELLCGEQKQQVGSKMRSRIHQIAVMDNGSGMDATVLRLALQFGNGTHLEEEKHTGIGRFGMGLPSSSVSQCQKVEVWTWQNGVEKALYSYLDLNEIKTQRINEVPEPQLKPIPSIWQSVGKNFGQSGTLVVWSDIDRCMWKTGKTIIDNSELLIGRMYRKFLDAGQVSIRMLAFDLDDTRTVIIDKLALPNDPGYLMAKTSCPEPFNNQPMFQPWEEAEQYEASFTIDFRDRQHEVKVRFSYAQEEARQTSGGKNPGDLPHGKHAAKNIGVSVVRAGRELDLDQSLVIKYDPTERWWGIEVEFPPSLDDLFGVTNNKQSARNFAELINIDMDFLLQGRKTITQLKEELREDEDPREPLLEIAHKINTQLSIIRKLIKAQRQGTRPKNNRYPGSTPEKQATRVTENRKQDGYKGESDKDESLPALQRQASIEKTLTDEGVAEIKAKELAATTISDNLKYTFADADLETAAFFSVKPKGGAILITLNTNHPAYGNLMEILEDEVDEVDTETLRSRLTNSLKGLKLLLAAWARYEDEQPDGKRRQDTQDARVDWGRIARQFLESEE
jgi:Histidine kinase-, DNA gyrase B-, and HSP90-like ATPase